MSEQLRREDLAAILLTAAAAFGLGLLGGLVAGEWLGDVDAERVRKAVGRLRPEASVPPDPAALETAVRRALRGEAATRYLKIRTRALGERLVELTGRVASETARERAGATARAAIPGSTVINRLLVEGEDLPRRPRSAGPVKH